MVALVLFQYRAVLALRTFGALELRPLFGCEVRQVQLSLAFLIGRLPPLPPPLVGSPLLSHAACLRVCLPCPWIGCRRCFLAARGVCVLTSVLLDTLRQHAQVAALERNGVAAEHLAAPQHRAAVSCAGGRYPSGARCASYILAAQAWRACGHYAQPAHGPWWRH